MSNIADMNNFEKLLYSKTVQTFPLQQADDLFGFWTLLKRQITERLSVISAIFPHYSLHDKSHSEKILDIIWKTYGEDSLKTLSVSNIFCILIVAYAHDLGMTVLSDDLYEVLDSDDFIRSIKKLQSEPTSPYYKYANCFDFNDGVLSFKKDIKLDSISYNAAKFLLSNYFRGKHAERSKNGIAEMFKPYKSFIKNSVLYQLGQICSSHNWTFDKVLTLPKEENGVYGDLWNPLFVACSLRLGDLLDLESDRFSESYWNSLPSRPFDSECHRQKHEAVKHFVVNQNIIEATAECSDYEVYKLLLDEFQMIKDEISSQMSHWNLIAPVPRFPNLPSLGEFSVSLNNYDTFDQGQIPSFHINQEKAFALIKGAGLYDDKFDAIREILQNAVDATYISCFLKNEKNEKSLDFKAFNDILSKERIEISLKKKDAVHENGKNLVIWNISITDNGIGMDKDDLKYLLDATSSSENPFKKEIITRMPEWLKPSGAFGLGFQSVFQLSDEITVTTRKINNPYEYFLELKSPSDIRKGNVLLRTEQANFSKQSGTTVAFDFMIPAIPEKWSISIDDPFSVEMISKFDFVTQESIDYEIAKIINAVNNFAFNSSIPISLQVGNDEPVVINRKEFESVLARQFNQEFGLELFVPKSNIPLRYFFRNVLISKTESRIRFIPFSANIFSGNAKDILKYNRDEFLDSEIYFKIHEQTILLGRKYLIENYDTLPDELKSLASMYVRYYETEGNKAELQNSEIYTKWETYTSSFEDKDIKFKDVVDFKGTVRLVIGHGGNISNPFFITKEKNNDDKEEILILTQFNLADELHFLIKEILRSGKQVLVSEYERRGIIFNFEKIENKKEPDYIKNYTSWFLYLLMTANYTSRFVIPCNGKYTKLAVASKLNFIPAEQTFRFLRNDFPIGMQMPVMVSPYILVREMNIATSLKLKDIDGVIDFAYENRADKKVTKKEINKLYKEFIEETKQAIEDANKQRSELF